MRISLKQKRPLLILIGSTTLVLLIFILVLTHARHMHRDGLFVESKSAINQGDVVRLQKLLQQGAPANGVDGAFIRGTPLCWAAQRGDVRMMKLLIQRGADVNKQGPEGDTALFWANGPEAVQFLVNAGANPLLRAGGYSAWDSVKAKKDDEIANILKRAAQQWRQQKKKEAGKMPCAYFDQTH